MAFVRRNRIARNFSLTKYYYTGRYHPKGERRAKRTAPSPESVKIANEKRAIENLMLTLNGNFEVDDYWVSLTYEGESKTRTLEQMKDDIRRFLRQLKRAYQKIGVELKFVYVLRVGTGGSRHFHLVINKADTKLIKKCWPFGYAKIQLVYSQDDSGTFDKLADYMIRESNITRETFKNDNLKRYSCSRNLEKPIDVTVVIRRPDRIREKAVAPKGWRVIPESDKLYCDAYGHICYEFKCVRIE